MSKTVLVDFECDDCDPLDIIDGFKVALKQFGIYIEDVTELDSEQISIAITDVRPDKELGDD